MTNNKGGFLDDKRKSKRIILRDDPAAVLQIAAGYKQAVLKIVSHASGKKSVSKLLNYISRNSNLELELNDGTKITTPEERKALVSEWNDLYFPYRKNARHTAHIVLSAPPETNRKTFNIAVREYLKENFADNHEYAFVQHDDTEHPHIHVILCLQGYRGNKLDIRKNDLRYLRENLAKHCRLNGIKLDASRRFERGISGKSSKSSMVQMRTKRQTTPKKNIELVQRVQKELNGLEKAVDTGEILRHLRHKNIKEHYLKMADSLLISKDNKVKKSGEIIYDFAKNFSGKKTRSEALRERIQEKNIYKNIEQDIEI